MNAPAPCPQPLSAAHGPDALVLAALSMRGGRPEPTRSNLLDIFRGDARVCGRLRYNDVTRNLELDDLQGQDCLFELRLFFERTYRITPGSKALVEAAEKAAKEHRNHPIQAWLDGLVWDGTPRIHRLFTQYFGADVEAMHAVYSRKFMVSMVARARKPGCDVHTMPILAGAQGLGKSGGVAALVPVPAWCSAVTLDAGSKDTLLALQGIWLAEVAELVHFGGGGSGALKALLTRASDRFRVPYGTEVRSFPRQSVCIGTTNSDELFDDPTGARRFWPMQLSRPVDIGALQQDRDQLFAEADAAYQQGAQWWLNADEEAAHEKHTRHFYNCDPWEPLLRAWVTQNGTGFTAEQALSRALHLPAAQQTRAQRTRVGIVLHGMGMEVTRPRVAGGDQRPRVYGWPEEGGVAGPTGPT